MIDIRVLSGEMSFSEFISCCCSITLKNPTDVFACFSQLTINHILYVTADLFSSEYQPERYVSLLCWLLL